MTTHLSLEAMAARQLLEALANAGEDDPEVLETAVEGETGFLEAVDRVLAELDDLEGMIAGGEDRVLAQETRLVGLRSRHQRIKGRLLAAVELANPPLPLRRPIRTVGVSKGSPKVLVTEEAEVPDRFFSEKTVRTLNLSLIRDALMRREPVPGCTLSNPCPVLTLRHR